MTADREYYDSLIAQGYPPRDAYYYTCQYFPNFRLVADQSPQFAATSQVQGVQVGQSNFANPQYIQAVQMHHGIQQKQGGLSTNVWIGIGVTGLVICVALVVLVATIFSSAGKSGLGLYVDDTPEFGFRHDVNPREYEDLGANRFPYAAGEQYPDFSSTVQVYGEDSSGDYWSGSAVIISEYWVLTAAHVVEDLVASKSDIYVGTDVGYGQYDRVYSIRNIYVHYDWNGDLESDADIALIQLNIAIDTGTSTIAKWDNITSTNRLAIGSMVYTSGYGGYDLYYSECSDYCLDDGNGEYSQRRAWSNVLDRKTDLWIVYDFDSPSGQHNALAAGETFTEQQGSYEYAGDGTSSATALSLEGTTVQGDSGGPTYAYLDGDWTVIGVTSHGSITANYGDVAFNTRVSTHTDWICSHDDVNRPIEGC